MKQRSECLHIVNDGGGKFTSWKKSQLDKVTADGKASNHLPIPMGFFQKLCSRDELKNGEIQSIGKGGVGIEITLETLKQQEDTFLQKVQAIQVLAQSVKSAISHYRSAKNSRDRHIENRQKAQSKQVSKQRESDESKQSTNFTESKYQVLDACLDTHPEIPSVDMSVGLPAGDTPWLVRQHLGLKDRSSFEFQKHIHVFMYNTYCKHIQQCTHAMYYGS